MTYGLSDTGFEIKRLSTIKSEIEQDQLYYFPGIDQTPESANGQQIGVYVKPLTDLWECIEGIFLSLSPSNAEGLALDYAVEYNGISRLPAQSTTVVVGLQGTKNTVVLEGTILQNANTLEFFETVGDTTITDEGLYLVYVKINSVVDNKNYTVKIDTETHTYNSGSGATAITIAAGLAALIDGASSIVDAEALANGVVKISAKDTTSLFDMVLWYDSAPVGTEMLYYTPAGVKSVVAGAKLASANTINIITTPVSGLSLVNNFEQGDLGSGVESDAELRIRRLASLQIAGAGTVEAIRSRIENEIDDLTSVKVYENREDITVGVLPPHSIHVVIEGLDTPDKDQEIGDLLWLVKPAGIQTYTGTGPGARSVNVTDSNGDTQVMKFTRPSASEIYVRVTVTKYTEESYPSGGDSLIKAAVVAYSDQLESGEDIIPLRIKAAIITAVPEGIQELVVELSIDNITYVTTPIAVSDTEIGQIPLANITVIS